MRYLILVLLNLPIVLLALVNLFTKYKIKRLTKRRFAIQIFLWAIIFIVVVGSFPLYNHLVGNSVFASDKLTTFDIVQTTAIIALIYIIGNQRQKLEQTERRMRDLHQELSIKLSSVDHKTTKN